MVRSEAGLIKIARGTCTQRRGANYLRDHLGDQVTWVLTIVTESCGCGQRPLSPLNGRRMSKTSERQKQKGLADSVDFWFRVLGRREYSLKGAVRGMAYACLNSV